MRLFKKSSIIFCSLLLLTACVKTKVIDDVEIIMLYGFDWEASTKEYIGTGVSPLYGYSEQADTRENAAYTSQSSSIQGITSQIQHKAPFQVETGKLTSVLFGEEVAQIGISDILQGINEMPDIGRMLHPLIVEGRAENLLSEQYQLEQTLPRYIKSLIDSNIKRNLPKMTLHDLNYRYYGEGMDPFMPIIADRETIVDIVGLGFFNHDKLVYKTGTDSFFAFKALYEDSNDATYQFEWKKKNKSLSVISIQSNQKKKWVSKNKLEITVKIEGYIAEAESLGLDKPQNKRKLEKQIGEKLEEECSELIKKFQELDIDPLMIGASAKSTFRDWNKKEWEETYPTIDIQPKIYFHIKQTNLTK